MDGPKQRTKRLAIANFSKCHTAESHGVPRQRIMPWVGLCVGNPISVGLSERSLWGDRIEVLPEGRWEAGSVKSGGRGEGGKEKEAGEEGEEAAAEEETAARTGIGFGAQGT